jgi:hydroxymethylglutaryl-CoA lyase
MSAPRILYIHAKNWGIETGVDLESLIEAARLAQRVVEHDLPGSVMKGGSLRALRLAR